MLLATVGVVLLAAASALTLAVTHLDAKVGRIDGVFQGIPQRPPVPSEARGATTVLVVVTYREPVGPAGSGAPADAGAAPGDAVMLLHLDAARSAAVVVALPRDTWVDIPGHGRGTVGDSFAMGGPRLAVETIERMTGLRVDHAAVTDWADFAALADTVGGIEVDVPPTVLAPVTGDDAVRWLDGDRLLRFVGPAGTPGEELQRIARQQIVLRATMQRTLHQEMRTQPLLLYRFLDVVTDHLAIDDTWSRWDIAKLLMSMRDFRSTDICYLTAPVSVGTSDSGRAVLRPESGAAEALWAELASDRPPTLCTAEGAAG